jgi:hypothetical protein
MKTARRVIWGALGLGMLASAMFGVSILSGKDSHVEAGAADTEITMGRSTTSPTYVASAVLAKGGNGSGPSPCTAGETDATTDCFYVWAKNVNNTTGAAAFQVKVTYNSNIVHVLTIAHITPWLASTGRSVACSQPTVTEVGGAGEALASCNTLLPPPPYGPNCPSHCSGQIGLLAFESKDQIGSTTLNFSESKLVDTPPDPDDAATIPATVRSVNVTVAKCADFTGNGGVPDGTVRIVDILYVVQRYFTPDADLDGDGTTRVADILIAVQQYFKTCTNN